MFECRIDFGSAYRVYFGNRRGTPGDFAWRRYQEAPQHDINAAVANWQDYKRRK